MTVEIRGRRLPKLGFLGGFGMDPVGMGGGAVAEQARGRGIDEVVMRTLQFGGLNPENVAELVEIVVTIDRAGIRPVKVFPKGIPAADGAWVQTVLDLSQVQTLLGLLQEIPRIDEVRVFPKGIPFPDTFIAEVGIR